MSAYELNIHPETIQEWKNEIGFIDTCDDPTVITRYRDKAYTHLLQHHPLLGDYITTKVHELKHLNVEFALSYITGFSIIYNLYAEALREKNVKVELTSLDMTIHRNHADNLSDELRNSDMATIFRALIGASRTSVAELFGFIRESSPEITDRLRLLLEDTEDINRLRLFISGICDGFLPIYAKFNRRNHELVQKIDEPYLRN